MKVYLSPQINKEKINYSFNGEVITATYKEITDTFNLSIFPDSAEITSITTSLEINPIISVKRESGILKVKLINFIDEDTTEQGKFPEWVEV